MVGAYGLRCVDSFATGNWGVFLCLKESFHEMVYISFREKRA